MQIFWTLMAVTSVFVKSSEPDIEGADLGGMFAASDTFGTHREILGVADLYQPEAT
jgi:hypothetical protein